MIKLDTIKRLAELLKTNVSVVSDWVNGVNVKPGQVVVSSTVKDLVVGSGLQFEDLGLHALKGVPDKWRLFAHVH